MANQESIISLNVGGERFCTSRQTLTWPGDSFFASLLSGRIGSVKDDKEAIFIDRDPHLFKIILNYLRTKQVDVRNVDITALKHEAQFYGLSSLVKRLTLCDELDQCACGDVLFHGYLSAPAVPPPERPQSEGSASHPYSHNRNLSEPPCLPSTRHVNPLPPRALPSMEAKFKLPPPTPPRPTVPSATVSEMPSSSRDLPQADSDSAKSSGLRGKTVRNDGDDNFELNRNAQLGGLNFAGGYQNSMSFPPNESACNYGGEVPFGFAYAGLHHTSGPNVPPHSVMFKKGHTRASSADFRPTRTHQRNRNGSDLTRQIRQELTAAFRVQTCLTDPCRVRIIRGHHNWIAVGYCNFLCCYRMKDSIGWHLTWISPRMESSVAHLALSAKPGSQVEKMLAVALENNTIHLWALNEDGMDTKIGIFSLAVGVDTLFFIGSQLVALSQTGKVGIWHAMTQNWQVQDVVPISSYDTAGSFLLLGCTNGSIYYIDMQKFPLRMKDNDLLVTELYRDPHLDVITSISVYLTPKTSLCGNWIEIAYGTTAGAVRVIVQHPETVGHGPQLFQTFNVHRAPITRVALTTNHLISICSEYNHVRTWTVTRFRGMISTQPGSTPLASFKVLTLESADAGLDSDAADAGPFGEQDGEQVFIQKVVPETNQLYVRMASNGERICSIRSVDGSSISSYLVHECEGSNRMGSRPRRYLFTGHSNGSIQMWDLTTAMDMYLSNKEKPTVASPQGPTPNELLQLIDGCEVTCSSSISTTPSLTPASSFLHLPQAGGAHSSAVGGGRRC